MSVQPTLAFVGGASGRHLGDEKGVQGLGFRFRVYPKTVWSFGGSGSYTGMFSLIPTVLNGDYRSPPYHNPNSGRSYRGKHPNSYDLNGVFVVSPVYNL